MKKPSQTVSNVPSLMKEWDFELNNKLGLDPFSLGAQSNKTAHWKCKYGHSWKAKINNRFNGRGCPECNKRKKTSFPEQAVFFYVRKKFPDSINSYKDIFSEGMELDIYIPSMKIGIEYDGAAWHKENMIAREQKKYKACKENGIYLIRLKENRNHCSHDLNNADSFIWVKQPFGSKKEDYHYLDYAIRELLHSLFDYDLSDMFSPKNALEILQIATDGPTVNTDVNSYRDRSIILENYLASLENKSLGHLYPDIAKKWHPTKNGELTPYMFTPHSQTRVWWIGECGHEWENPITVMTRGQGCPYCSGQRVLKGFNDLETKNPEIAKQWHPTKNGNKKPSDYTFGSGHKAFWLCQNCHQTWEAHINNRTLHNRGCPYCAHEKPIKGVNDLPTLRPDLMEEWDWEKNKGINPTDLMPSSNKQVFWKCKKCGYEYKAYLNNRAKGTGCKKCAGQVVIKGVNDFETLFPEIAKEWDYDSNDLKPSEVFARSNKKFYWKCFLGHKWDASPNSRSYGRGCPYCSGNKVLIGFNDLATTHPEIAKQWHPTLNGELLPTQISKGYKNKVWFLCDKCNTAYDSHIGNKIKGYGNCPKCSNRKSRAQLIELVETGQTFATLKEAAKAIGKEDYRNIHCCCSGKTKTAYGYHWRYIEKGSI